MAGSGPNFAQTKKVIIETATTIGTKYFAILSILYRCSGATGWINHLHNLRKVFQFFRQSSQKIYFR
jgi:hypothetical protein